MIYYEKVFRGLNKSKVEYLVAGGVAVVLHGVVRLTVDLDIFIDLSQENIKKFILAMGRLGYKPSAPVKIEELLDHEKRKLWIKEKKAKVFSLFNSRRKIECVDVFLFEPISFSKAYKNKYVAKIGNIKIPVVDLSDLIKLKKISARPQDIADVQALKYLHKLRRK